MLRRLRAWFVNDTVAAFVFAGFWLDDLLASWRRPGDDDHWAIGRRWGKLLLRATGVRLRVTGQEGLDTARRYVFVANHASYMDTPALYASAPVPFRFIARHSLFRVPVIGGHLRRGGHVPIVREEGRAALRALARAAAIVTGKNVSMVVFAEGTRSRGDLQSFRGGAAWLALKVGAPLVPVAIKGTQDILPRGSAFIRAGAVEVTFGAPIEVEGMTPHDREQLTALVHDKVAELLGERGKEGAIQHTGE